MAFPLLPFVGITMTTWALTTLLDHHLERSKHRTGASSVPRRTRRRKKRSRYASVTPRLGPLSVREAEVYLQSGLVGLNEYQLENGVPPISQALHEERVRYERRDPQERWMSIREIWEAGGDPPAAVRAYRQREGLRPHTAAISGVRDGIGRGDCEDLAAAVAAERTRAGHPSTLVLIRVGPRLSHAVVKDLNTGDLHDPSLTGGMARSRRE